MFEIVNLKVSVDPSTDSGQAKEEILKGVSLRVLPGELHVIMGPNGSGKSTLAQAIMGNPKFTVDGGRIAVDNREITKLAPDKRAKLGLFLAFQHPVEVPGVKMYQFLRMAGRVTPLRHVKRGFAGREKNGESKAGEFREFLERAKEELKTVGLEENFLERSLNEGFSGGEKKRSEIFQLAILSPKIAILDEPDSGLDVDGQKIVAQKVTELVKSGTGILLITHNPRILKFLKPDKVYVMIDGLIVKSGSIKLARQIEEKGYAYVNS